MCKVGDIIVVEKYISVDGKEMPGHSFVVVDDNADKIRGLSYDFVANVMSSFKSEEHKRKKLRYEENLGVTSEDIISNIANDNEGYIKADQLYYFDKETINYYVLATLSPELLDELIQLIIHLEVENKLKQNLNNLQEVPMH